MRNNKETLLWLITVWMQHNEKMKEINTYLYNHTELFEKKYTDEFKDKLFKFFAGKITRYSRDYNQLMDALEEEDKRQIQVIKLLER